MNTCSIEGCSKPLFSGVLCNGHYTRQQRFGDVRADIPLRPKKRKNLDLPPGYLWCRLCETGKPDEEMIGASWFHARGWQSAECKECKRDRNPPQNPVAQRRWSLKMKYNMSEDEYNHLLAFQGNVCAVCKKPPKDRRLCVDHDHECCPGEFSCGDCIRGLLCACCNMKIDWHLSYGGAADEYISKYTREIA